MRITYGMEDGNISTNGRSQRPCIVFHFVLVLAATSLGAGLSSHSFSANNEMIRSACSSVLYPPACVEHILSSFPSSLIATPQQLVMTSSKLALKQVIDALNLAKNLSTEQGNGLENAAINDCVELLGDARHQMSQSVFELSKLDSESMTQQLESVKIWISAALTGLTTCADGFIYQTGTITDKMLSKQTDVSKVITNALYLVTQQLPSTSSAKIHSRGLLFYQDEFPEWLSSADRKLLQTPPTSHGFDVVVARDGTGQYKKIKNALGSIPVGYVGRYVIYIKAGVYKETVDVPVTLQNITFLGDGINKTIISGNKNVASNRYTTFRTSTVGISGQGFIARGITFRNTAGAQGYQAVALRAGADYLVFDNCSFEGYQDTLYALSSRQFYRNCKIYGTVDFIFGNAAAIFQNSELLARQPLRGQQNTITAHGRKVAVDPTGFSFQNCSLIAADELKASNFSVSTYLGRPWKAYARTVFLRSYLGSFIDPAGWLQWNASDPFEDTVYYGEFDNDGPGAGIKHRVNWPGVHSNMSYENATMFSVVKFISGDTWLPEANVEVTENI